MKQMNEAPHNVKPSSSILVGLCTAHGYEERRKSQRETWLTQPEEDIQTLFFLGEGDPEYIFKINPTYNNEKTRNIF